MKKIVLILFLFIPLFLKSQTIELTVPARYDTVFCLDSYFAKSVRLYAFSATVDMVNVTSGSIKLTFGGSDKQLNRSTNLYAFCGFANDSLPATLTKASLKDTTSGNGGTYITYLKRFPTYQILGISNLCIKLWRYTATAGIKIPVYITITKLSTE